MVHHPASDTRQRILEAAVSQFARLGFHKVTMGDIARAVGMGKTSLYYYFPSKDDLFRVVVMNEQTTFAERISAILARPLSASEMVKAYVEDRFNYMNRLLYLNILHIHPDDTIRPVLRSVFREFSKQEHALLRRIIEEGKKMREFDVASPAKVAQAFLDTLQGLRLRYVRRFSGSLVELKDYRKLKPELMLMTEIFIRGIRHEG